MMMPRISRFRSCGIRFSFDTALEDDLRGDLVVVVMPVSYKRRAVAEDRLAYGKKCLAMG